MACSISILKKHSRPSHKNSEPHFFPCSSLRGMTVRFLHIPDNFAEVLPDKVLHGDGPLDLLCTRVVIVLPDSAYDGSKILLFAGHFRHPSWRKYQLGRPCLPNFRPQKQAFFRSPRARGHLKKRSAVQTWLNMASPSPT